MKISTIIYAIAIFLLLKIPVGHAEESLDGPYIGMSTVGGTMLACAFLAPGDINADTHCFGAVAETFLFEIVFANTDYSSWLPATIACVTGALWEIRDHQGFGVSSIEDFVWTCGPAITTGLGFNSIFKFYEDKNTPKLFLHNYNGTPSLGVSYAW